MGWFQPCLMKQQCPSGFSELESVGVSNNCVFNSITELLGVFALYLSEVTGEYKAV